jgi:hypothetical protein
MIVRAINFQSYGAGLRHEARAVRSSTVTRIKRDGKRVPRHEGTRLDRKVAIKVLASGLPSPVIRRALTLADACPDKSSGCSRYAIRNTHRSCSISSGQVERFCSGFLTPSAGALCRGCRSEALCDSRGGQVGSNDAFRSGIILNIAPTRSQQPLVQSRLHVIPVISF